MQRAYTIKEEIWSSIVHGIGIVFGIAALTVLTAMSARLGDVWSIVSSAIFGTSMILLYSASTLYHAITNENAKKILKKFDHIAIY
ncbi:MAG: hemolysin III family protein, partial [Alphaproteobacteria bacterium]|nr:hemolysin III family protein [Alphaproteobacteria bacterium]